MQCFSRENNLVDHKEVCLKINVKWQRVKSRNGSIEFNNYSTQLVVPFKIYDDFESILRRVQRNNKSRNASYTKKHEENIPCSFAYKFASIDDRFSKPVVPYISQ